MEASATFQNIPPDKQARVLARAQEEFARHGFAAASMNRLAVGLGIAKGSLFKYFGSKENLFATVFDMAVAGFSEHLRGVRAETSGRPLRERLERIFVAGTDFVAAHPNILRLYLKILAGGDMPLRQGLLLRVRGLSARFLTPIVKEAKAAGELPGGVDTTLAVFVADAILDRFVQAQAEPWMDTGLSLAQSSPEAVRQAARSLSAMLARALGAKG